MTERSSNQDLENLTAYAQLAFDFGVKTGNWAFAAKIVENFANFGEEDFKQVQQQATNNLSNIELRTEYVKMFKPNKFGNQIGIGGALGTRSPLHNKYGADKDANEVAGVHQAFMRAIAVVERNNFKVQVSGDMNYNLSYLNQNTGPAVGRKMTYGAQITGTYNLTGKPEDKIVSKEGNDHFTRRYQQGITKFRL